jgi:uncharacterized protein YukE
MSTTQMWAGEGSLGRAAGLVAEARVDFDRLAADLTARIVADRSRWQGIGGRSFFALQQAWADKQRTIVAALSRFEQALLQTQSANAATDADAAGLQQTHLARLDGISR